MSTKPYDKLAFTHIGAGQPTPTLEERVNDALDEAVRSLLKKGAGKTATVNTKIVITAIRDQSSGEVVRFDVSGQPSVKPAALPGCSTLAFPDNAADPKEALTSASRQTVLPGTKDAPTNAAPLAVVR